MYLQSCPICNEEFKVYGKQKRVYCSMKCLSRAYTERLKGENNPNYRHGPKSCEKCGKDVWGEKMFNTIIQNMERARERGDLI